MVEKNVYVLQHGIVRGILKILLYEERLIFIYTLYVVNTAGLFWIKPTVESTMTVLLEILRTFTSMKPTLPHVDVNS
jgi:hypothetical protein